MTNIEWVRNPDGTQGITWNPLTGCLNHVNGLCKGGGFPCYAYKLAHTRLKQRYLANPHWELRLPLSYTSAWDSVRKDPFYPRFWEERLAQMRRGYHYRSPGELHPSDGAAPRGIFVCDMGDLFGIGIPEQWTRQVLDVINEWDNEVDRFYLLTKQPQNLNKFSPFPENCWVGVTVTNAKMLREALTYLEGIEAKVKFVSLEPLLSRIYDPLQFVNALPDFLSTIDWLIIGACTGTKAEMTELVRKYPELTVMPFRKKWTAQPHIEWVREIVEAADKAGIPVFLKDNLLESVNYQSPETEFAFNKEGYYRQELPK